MRSIGIDIGRFSVKIVTLEVAHRGVTLADVYEIPLNPEPGADQKIALVEILREVANKTDPTQTMMTMALQQQHVSLRHRFFPFKERKKILQSLPFELEDELPLSQDNAIFEAKILSTNKVGANVLAFVCPKEDVQGCITSANDGGIDPDVISCEAQSLASLVEHWQSPPLENVEAQNTTEEVTTTEIVLDPVSAKVILHLGHERSLLCIFHKDSLLASRTFFYGGSHIIQSLQKDRNIPYAEAMKLLIEEGSISVNNGSSNEPTSAHITTVLDELFIEVRRALLEIQSEYRVRVDHIDLTGGLSRVNNLTAYMTQKMEVPCNILNPFHLLQRQDIEETLASRLSVALGLAIEGARRPINPPVNFRKEEFSKENLSWRLLTEKWGYSLKLAGVALAVLYVFSFFRGPLTESLTDASYTLLRNKAQEVGIKKNKASPANVRKYIREKQVEIKKRQMLSNLRNIDSAMAPLNKLSTLIPSRNSTDLNVRRFQIADDLLTIEGDVAKASQLAQVKQAVTNLAADKKLNELAPTLAARAGRLNFAYQVKVQRRSRM